MKSSLLIKRTATLVLVATFAVVSPLPTLIPSVEAASPSASARVIQKLKKQIATLKKQLAAATTPPAPFIEVVKVGNVGNAPDQDFGQGALGRVNYEFQIGKTEVTLAQYTAFLNAVAATDTHALCSSALATNENIAGIAQNGTSGNFTYSVIGTGTRPVTFVSWFDAARFCNWLHNGRPTGAQNAGTTEQGAYTLDGTTSGGLDIVRNPGARFWIPSENEWYKAAYHQPAAQGGDTDDYWLYPTRSNTPPGNQIGPLPLANHANLRIGSNFSVTQAASLSPTQNYLTAPGSYPASAGFYGTTDQGGNVGEWTEGVVISFSERAVRGGDWNSDEARVRSSVDRASDSRVPSTKRNTTGFRVAAP
jgi:formylglycine-generating enzyme required for sulfatase activity